MAEGITLTTEAARMFLAWLESGDGDLLRRLMKHPGYRTVVEHSGTWGSPVSEDDVKNAVAGKPSPMYGVGDVRDNASRILQAIDYVEAGKDRIIDLVEASLSRVFSPDLAYPVGMHCIVGYDWGIGLRGKVAVNLNSRLYLDDFREIDYMLVHEATHVAYERAHGPMSPKWLGQPDGLRRLVCTLVQNEGLAVYSPLRARTEGDCLGNRDYRLLSDPVALAEKTLTLKRLLADLVEKHPGEEAAGKVLDLLSKERLSYVVGCSGFVALERRGGLALVRQAALWSPEEFVAKALP